MEENKTYSPLIPGVSDIKYNNSFFTLNSESKISISDEKLLGKGELLKSYLSPATGFSLPVIIEDVGDISLILLDSSDSTEEVIDEKYIIEISENKCKLKSQSLRGLTRAIQTLRQLFPSDILLDKVQKTTQWVIPGCVITDTPRFKWRGMHLDVGRHFMKKEEVIKFIDLIALYKFNTFHLHLTEDQGWRIEIKKYPLLTEIGSFRDATLVGHLDNKPKRYDDIKYGGFYTQEDIKEIVAYAKEREITIVPEIDMPGHMQAAISAYPELGCTDMTLKPLCHWGVSQHILNVEDSTIDFVKDVMDEVMDLFPGDYIHIGGDEAAKYEWQEQRRVQDRMVELGVNSEDELQSWFISQIASHIQNRGKKVIGWDEVLDGGLAEGVAVMSWRGEEGGIKAAGLGHDVIMTPLTHVYFDYYQGKEEDEPLALCGFTPLDKVYHYEPIPDTIPEDQYKFILGSQGQLWTEYMKDFKMVEYMAFPRVCALAEVLWMEKKDKNYDSFLKRMEEHKKKLTNLNVNFRNKV